MKAIIYEKYGSPEVLKYKEMEKPTPNDDELLIKVQAASVTPGDCEMRSFTMPLIFWFPLRIMFGIFHPKRKILGLDMAGEVVAVGKNINNFKAGDQVFASTGSDFGAYAQYACLSNKNAIALKSPDLSFAEAVSIPTGGLNALHYLKLGQIQKGQKVLIIGAGGNFGMYGVQLAKYFGAEVTAVDNSEKLDFMRRLGADHVIDYTSEDFSDNGVRYDFIFDVASKKSCLTSLKSLTKNGRLVIANPRLRHMLCGIWASLTGGKKIFYAFADYKSEDLIYLQNLVTEGKIKIFMDRLFKMEDVVEAHHYVEAGHKKGSVALQVGPEA